MTDDDLKYWLALKWVEGVGNVAFTTLIGAFGSPEEVFRVPLNILKAAPGIGQRTAQHIKSFSQWKEVDREREQAEKQHIALITCQNPIYPKYLLNIYDFPPFLYVKGDLQEDDVNIAVVGSRQASPYGRFSTERICRELALKGVTIVSGLARGIDAAAHRGSLSAKGRTIAVLGCGIDIIYPRDNQDLFDKIPLQGAIVTEFRLGTPPSGPNFPARNRIISGLSLGVVVVEATYRSGSLITARLALEQGREVFAVPGSIDSAASQGTNKLIKDGAKLVANADDILEEILPMVESRSIIQPLQKSAAAKPRGELPPADKAPRTGPDLTDGERRTLMHLSTRPVDIDTLISQTGEKAGDILNTLLLLELKGIIHQLPGKMFILKEQ